jgi:hypothetical protein
MLNTRVSTSVVAALAITITTQSFAQDRGTGATPAAGEKTGATQGTFTTSDAIPWKPVDPKHPGLEMFVVWGNPNEGGSASGQLVEKEINGGRPSFTILLAPGNPGLREDHLLAASALHREDCLDQRLNSQNLRVRLRLVSSRRDRLPK